MPAEKSPLDRCEVSRTRLHPSQSIGTCAAHRRKRGLACSTHRAARARHRKTHPARQWVRRHPSGMPRMTYPPPSPSHSFIEIPEHGFIHHRASARVLRIAGREAWHAQLIAPREPDIERLNRPGNRFSGIPQETQTQSPHPRYRCSLMKDQLHLRNAPGTSLLRRLAHFNPMSCFQRSA